MSATLTHGFALLWAGVSLGGALIAAPAKFQAPSLTLPVALEVGRAQFRWVGYGEWGLCIAFVLSLFLLGGLNWRWALIPLALFAIQQFAVMPPLDARTLQVIAGDVVEKSSLHIIYIVLEFLKFFSLTGIGLGALFFASKSAG